MTSIKEAYLSLEKVKREQSDLCQKRDNLMEASSIIKPFCSDYRRYQTLDGAFNDCSQQLNNCYFNLGLALIVYILVFGIVDFIAVTVFGNVGMITTSIGAGIGSYSVNAYKQVKKLRSEGKVKNDLTRLQRILSQYPEYSGLSLYDIEQNLLRGIEMLKDDLYLRDGAINEYEKILNEANKELAEEILSESGIEASVTLDSSMKVLSKSYDEKKKRY